MHPDRRVWLIVAACVWELVALASGFPTITAIVHRLRVHRVGRIGVWLLLGWLIEHLFGEGRSTAGAFAVQQEET